MPICFGAPALGAAVGAAVGAAGCAGGEHAATSVVNATNITGESATNDRRMAVQVINPPWHERCSRTRTGGGASRAQIPVLTTELRAAVGAFPERLLGRRGWRGRRRSTNAQRSADKRSTCQPNP